MTETLDRLKTKLALSNAVIEKIAYIYRKALDKGLVRGRLISGLIAYHLFMLHVEILKLLER